MRTLQLYLSPGSATYDLPSLDADSLVAASYLQLLRPNEWEMIYSTNSGLSPNGALPYLKDGQDVFSASDILPHLLRSGDGPRVTEDPDARAFHALADSTLLPLALHSLFSLPHNWTFVRKLLADPLPYPSKLYRPEQVRQAARLVVDATHPPWWGLGGEAEKEDEDERTRRKLLLDNRLEAYKERKDEERRESKERIKKTFGEGKISSAARDAFTAFESTLAQSSTPYFFSASSPTPLDAHLSAVLSLVLYLPLPQPLLADLINAAFPRIWAHTALLRRTLWSTPPPLGSSISFSLRSSLADLIPDALWNLGVNGTIKSKQEKRSKKDEEFARKRWIFLGVVCVGLAGWAVGVGALPLPGRPGIWAKDDEDEQDAYGEWENV